MDSKKVKVGMATLLEMNAEIEALKKAKKSPGRPKKDKDE